MGLYECGTNGEMAAAPPLLRSICNMIMIEARPGAIFWGEFFAMIYNEAFIIIAGQKQPDLVAQYPTIPFVEVWKHFEGI